ncbi:MAG: response regulator [Deltaproteobacteria bacterium]|nr:response regulator [Deltaproteobacteria bacterium]
MLPHAATNTSSRPQLRNTLFLRYHGDPRDSTWPTDVTTASSAPQALDLLASDRPDVLVSDIAMPEHDGYHLIQSVRALPTDRGGATPAIALTAFARLEDRTRAMLAGFQNHVPKPVEPGELIAAIISLDRRPRV